LVLIIIAVVAIGAALFLAEPFEYRCAATIRIASDADAEQITSYRAELLNRSWEAMRNVEAEDSRLEQWSVEFPASNLLRLSVTTAGRQHGLDRVNAVAASYLRQMESHKARARTEPTETEAALSQQASRLTTRLTQLEDALENARASIPSDDPGGQREGLQLRWQSLRSRFSALRQECVATSAEVRRLRSEPAPTHGIVPSDERRRALQADAALQQDLSELRVRLSEMKLELLKVWEQSAGRLAQLESAANEMKQAASFDPAASTPADLKDLRPALERLAAEAARYQETLQVFTAPWRREFAVMRELEIDPRNGELLDAHDRLREHLSDFLFHAAKCLTTMRGSVEAIGGGVGDFARHHVLQSNLTRGFQTLQTAHHRFEFSASALDMSDNFRLDAAIRSGYGLHRRSQQRIRLIEERLQAEAAERARIQRANDLAEAERRLVGLRERADTTIEELLVLQDELNLNADQRDAYLHSTARRDVLAGQWDQTRDDLGDIRKRTDALAAKRIGILDRIKLELVSCQVLDGPTNLGERCRTAGIGAGLALAALLLLQWWIIRRA
jgi:hypothetical protein